MTEETKICPYCGKEIRAKVSRCYYCKNYIGNDTLQTIGNDRLKKIESLNISEKWKERFRLIEKYYDGGYIPNQNYKELTFDQKLKVNFQIFSWASLLGVFFYLAKGMWVKAIIYTILCYAFGMGFIVYIVYTPFDYYRKIVLDKQL